MPNKDSNEQFQKAVPVQGSILFYGAILRDSFTKISHTVTDLRGLSRLQNDAVELFQSLFPFLLMSKYLE
jgi:hypothetical protein